MSRGIVIVYGLLVLVPALVLGLAAFRLLGHEQERLRLAATAALEERARAVAENIAVAVNDTEDGLMGTLAALPETELIPALTEWRDKNPLIRDVFVWEAGRGFLYPLPAVVVARKRASPSHETVKRSQAKESAAPAAKALPQAGGASAPAAEEDATVGKQRRLGVLLAGRTPWRQADVQQAAEPPATSARQELNNLVINSVPSQLANTSQQRVSSNLGNPRQQGYAMRNRAPVPASAEARLLPAAANAMAAPGGQADQPPAEQHGGKDRRGEAAASSPAPVTTQALRAQSVVAQPAAPAPRVPAFGWMPLVAERTPALLGWFQPASDRPVRGIELAMDVLLPKLAAGLPADPPRGTVMALVNGGSSHCLTRPGVPRPGTNYRRLFHTPVGPALPHWEVTVYAAPAAAGSQAFLLVALLLTGIFLVAILTGGALLLAEAHRSQRDARRKTGFVSNVSHELKTPLTSIRMYAELLGEGRVPDEAKRRHYLDIIVTESQRLTRLINNVLDFSRIEQHRKSYNLAEADLAQTIRDVLSHQAMRLQEAGLARVETALPPGEFRVKTDRDVVEQVLINLVDNATKYATTGGELRIEAVAAGGGTAEIRVLDRGPGIPPSERERVFEKFYRMDHTLTGGKPGCGLGLTLSRKMLRDLGGDLLCSPRPGGGTCFTLRLGGV